VQTPPRSRRTLRLPPELKERVQRLAAAQRRSVNAELLILIELGCKAEEKEVSRRGAPQPR
jgi:predicted transcriptional regulator